MGRFSQHRFFAESLPLIGFDPRSLLRSHGPQFILATPSSG